MMNWKGAAILVVLCHSALADHPCSTEVASACADRPSTDIGACLKDPEEHDYPTEISSACTDYIALNKACAEDIENYCEAGAFTDDTILCLTKWTPEEDLSPKCQGVLKWAVPQADAEGAEEVVTDELGMSDEDYAEKKEWQKKRAAARGDAIERMKLKKEDAKKEEERASLEEYKKNDPEGYASMIQQQEEEKRQQANFKKQERARAAALERAKKKASGEEEEEETPTRKGAAGSKSASKSKGSWLYSLMSFVVLCLVGAGGYALYTNLKGSGGRGSRKATKKKRG